MRSNSNHREGFALPAALLALVVVGALVTGGVYASMSADRGSSNMAHSQYALLAAERGLQELLGTKDRRYFRDMGPVGTVDVIGPHTATIGGLDVQYTVSVHRLSDYLFRVDSEGEITSAGRYSGSKRQITEMMRISENLVPMDRAVTTHGSLRARGLSGISGQDMVPTGWTDCTDDGLGMGVVHDHAATISVQGAAGITGDPKEVPTELDPAKFDEYGDLRLDELKVLAEKVYEPGEGHVNAGDLVTPVDGSGVCDTSVEENWGAPNDPAHACHYYWPIIYSKGDMKLAGNTSGGGASSTTTEFDGQGILIVDGDLEITGGFGFTGIVFVYGSLKAAGTGNKLSGSVNILNNSGGLESDIGEASSGQGNTQIHRSTCAIQRALLYNERLSRPDPLTARKYVDVSALGVT